MSWESVPAECSIKPRPWKHLPLSPASLLWSYKETVTCCYLLISSLDLTGRSGTKTSLTRNMPREHEEASHSDRCPGPTLSPRGKRGPVATQFPFPEPWGPGRAAVGPEPGSAPLLGSCEQRPGASLRRGTLFNPHPHANPLSGRFWSLKHEPRCVEGLFRDCVDLKNNTLPPANHVKWALPLSFLGGRLGGCPQAAGLSGPSSPAHGQEH